MKISLVITEGAKQIMMTPENDHERKALRFIQPEDNLKAVSRWGTFDNEPNHCSYNVGKSQGGTYRRYATEDSLMFVVEDEAVEN